MSYKFVIRDTKTNGYVAGPFSRKKIKRIHGLLASVDGEKRYDVIRLDKADDFDDVVRDPETGHTPGELEELENVKNDSASYQFRTGIFKFRQSVVDLMNKLEITDYKVERAKSGYFADYN